MEWMEIREAAWAIARWMETDGVRALLWLVAVVVLGALVAADAGSEGDEDDEDAVLWD